MGRQDVDINIYSQKSERIFYTMPCNVLIAIVFHLKYKVTIICSSSILPFTESWFSAALEESR